MALDKSVKHTPGSRSGYLSELSASSGSRTNFLLPVRIKVTTQERPPNTCPLSDGKKPKFQPVLIKDLLSSHKDKNNSTLTSVSTQKKKPRPQRIQPYLNTQSCYKPKNEEDEESFALSRQSFGGSKVRRQLYQTLDSPQKFGLESKENSSKTIRPKKTKTEESMSRRTQVQDKNRKSLLLPPNSIKNSVVHKSGTISRVPSKTNVKSTISNVNRQSKAPTRVTSTRTSVAVTRKSVFTKAERNEDVESDYSTPDSGDSRQQSLYNKHDKCTMTSPAFNRGTFLSKSTSDLSKLDVRPSVIMSPSKSASKNQGNTELPYLQMQNLNINQPSQSFSQTNQIHMQSSEKAEFDFSLMNKFDSNNLMQFKSFLEHSIESCEAQVSNLKQVLSFVNTMLNSKKPEPCIKSNESPNDADKLNTSSKFAIYHDDCDDTQIVEKSVEMNNLTFEADVLGATDCNVGSQSSMETMSIVEEKLPVPIKILVNDADLSQESKELSMNSNDLARLSTIGEVSCEAEECENKESQSQSRDITPATPKTPKQSMRRSTCDSSNRRRSARLASKRTSLSELDNHDSFTMLENELNVERPIPSKSLPASPMKPPTTPGVIRHWDKKIERPLKEYMALKMNGTFLVTPDVKRFQSCLDLEPTDTPHSRKSMSRKIFMELCDLYAESPESK